MNRGLLRQLRHSLLALLPGNFLSDVELADVMEFRTHDLKPRRKDDVDAEKELATQRVLLSQNISRRIGGELCQSCWSPFLTCALNLAWSEL